MPLPNEPRNGWKMPSSSSARDADALVGDGQHRGRTRPSTRSRAALSVQRAAVAASRAGRWWRGSRRSAAPGSRRPRRATSSAGSVDVDRVPLADLVAVAQQRRRVLHHAAQIELLELEALRPRVGEKRSDRVVQPLGLAQHDVHQLRLIARQRQLLPQDLHRARHRRQRIADLVRDAGGHLADGRQTLLQLRIALEPLALGHVLERVEIAAPAVGQRQLRDAQAEIDDAIVRPLVLDVGALAARARAAPRRASSRSSAGSCSTSAAGLPEDRRRARGR